MNGVKISVNKSSIPATITSPTMTTSPATITRAIIPASQWYESWVRSVLAERLQSADKTNLQRMSGATPLTNLTLKSDEFSGSHLQAARIRCARLPARWVTRLKGRLHEVVCASTASSCERRSASTLSPLQQRLRWSSDSGTCSPRRDRAAYSPLSV